MATSIKSFGKVSLIEDDTTFQISYNGTVRMHINKTTGTITFGAIDGTPDLGVFMDIGYFLNGANFGSIGSGAELVNISNGNLGLDGSLIMSGVSHYFIPPKMTTAQRDDLTPVEGMTIGNITTHKLQYYDGTVWQDCF